MECTRLLGSMLVLATLALTAPPDASAQAAWGGTVSPGEKKIYIGNLPLLTNDEEVREMFEQFGEVKDIAMINDRDAGRPLGFGFVVMDGAAADQAIAELDNAVFDGRTLAVKEVRPGEERMAPQGRGGYAQDGAGYGSRPQGGYGGGGGYRKK